uniref:Uncharacterized protein n=1 Tax=Romanomermis culicivorax TaxID=13658 RepID=A0A915KH65_ROMCU
MQGRLIQELSTKLDIVDHQPPKTPLATRSAHGQNVQLSADVDISVAHYHILAAFWIQKEH